MNSRDLAQVSVFRRYLLERADRSRSRLMREQIRRWVEWIDAVQRRQGNNSRSVNDEPRRTA